MLHRVIGDDRLTLPEGTKIFRIVRRVPGDAAAMPVMGKLVEIDAFEDLTFLALAQQLPTPPALAAKSWLLIEAGPARNSPPRRPMSASNRPR
jgi:hypothetical protein